MIGLLLAAIVHTSAIRIAEDTTVMVRAVVEKTVMADNPDEASETYGRFICTGVVVASHGTYETVVTARHCASSIIDENDTGDVEMVSLTPVSVQFFDGDVGIIKDAVNDVYSAPNDDIMVLKVHSMRKHPIAHLATKSLFYTQPLFGFGSPLGNHWSYMSALASHGSEPSHTALPVDWDTSIEIECSAMDHGASGGPMFDMQGNVVGLMLGGDASQKAIAPAYRIRNFLHTLK